MLRGKTTFIIGAGASVDLGLPVGDGLKTQISQLLSPSTDNMYGFSSDVMHRYLQQRTSLNGWQPTNQYEPIQEAARIIRRGLPLAVSIDNLLHSHQGNSEVEQLGKFAIAHCIAQAERASSFFPRGLEIPRHGRPAQADLYEHLMNNGWYASLARLLYAGCQKSNPAMAFTNVQFVIFNYDRCLEHFLWLSLQAYLNLDGSTAAAVLDGVDFVHPYGSLGQLEWQHGNDAAVPLGGGDGQDYIAMSSRIKTFTETVTSEIGQTIKEAVGSAETLIILGFGYLDQNVKLLTPEGNRYAQRVLTTLKDASLHDQYAVISTLESLAPATKMPIIEVGTCRDLFDHCALELSLR